VALEQRLDTVLAMAGAPVFVSHPSSLEHDTGGHPEQPARIVAIERELDARGWFGFSRVSSPEVSREALTAVHPVAQVEKIEAFSARGGGHIDMDTVVSAGSYEAALHAAGGAVHMVDLLLDSSAPCGFSAHRPPGHHALPSRAMGFCLFNNVAVAARHALSARGRARVMIVDWDVHHGNGTNDIFFESPDVLFVSIHQSPLYPGTGAVSEIGAGEGLGFTVNLPVPPGSGDDEFVGLVDGVAVPLARAFSPQLVLISAGYDAHADDPLADCCVTEAGYAAMTSSLLGVAAAVGAPVGAVLEGGYALGALARSVAATMDVMAGGGGGGAASAELTPLAAAARARLSQWWPSLA
jgi:acetoin utilization deacetylase AcuC-like enzyme